MTALPTSVLRIRALRCVTSCVQITTAAVFWMFFHSIAKGRILTSLSKALDGLEKSEPFRNRRTSQVPLNISYSYFHLFMAFFVQPNKPQCRMPLTSILTANYHSTTQNVSPLCTSTPSCSSATPPTPFRWTMNGFYFLLSGPFKILGC